MLRTTFFILFFIITNISAAQWENRVSNYSFENVSTYPPPASLNNNKGECLPSTQGSMEYIEDYWGVVSEWTHPLKRNFTCGGTSNPPVPTADLLKYGYFGNPTEYSRHGGQYYGRGGRENLDDNEVLITTLKGCFDGTCLFSDKTYYMEFFFNTDADVKVWIDENQPTGCGEDDNNAINDLQQLLFGFAGSNISEFNSPTTPNLDNKWKKFSGYFKPEDDLKKWLIITSNGPIDDIKIYEVDDNLCRNEWYFDNTVFVKNKEIFQAGDFIKAGTGVDIEASQLDGPVTVMAGAHTIFTAGNAIILEPGFVVEQGATAIFETDTIPCKDLCPDFINFPNKNCVSQPVQIGNSIYENTYVQITWQPTSYLDNPNSPNPTFTPPPGSGEITYYATYTSKECGFPNFPIQIIDTVIITYTDQPNTAPTISISNVVYDNYDFSADITVNSVVQEIEVTFNGFYNTFILERGVDFTSNTFPLILNNLNTFTNACNNVTINLTVKSVCNQAASTSILWQKVDNFGFIGEIPNVFSPNGDGINDYYCFNANASSYIFSVYHSWGNLLYQETGSINSSYTCLDWQGEIDAGLLYPSTYLNDNQPVFTILEIYDDCGNYDSRQRQMYVQDAGQMILNPNNPAEISVEIMQQNGNLVINNNSNENYNIIITNVVGQVVFNGELTTTFSKQLANGIYYVTFINNNQEIELKRKISIIN